MISSCAFFIFFTKSDVNHIKFISKIKPQVICFKSHLSFAIKSISFCVVSSFVFLISSSLSGDIFSLPDMLDIEESISSFSPLI